ncbi:hypothetical protein BDZ97DRAFT_2062061 [Flammula alnicola]|nr:hypothetical protein BDZ97DRAFT_2062061 [Flammula alnicola]
MNENDPRLAFCSWDNTATLTDAQEVWVGLFSDLAGFDSPAIEVENNLLATHPVLHVEWLLRSVAPEGKVSCQSLTFINFNSILDVSTRHYFEGRVFLLCDPIGCVDSAQKATTRRAFVWKLRRRITAIITASRRTFPFTNESSFVRIIGCIEMNLKYTQLESGHATRFKESHGSRMAVAIITFLPVRVGRHNLQFPN